LWSPLPSVYTPHSHQEKGVDMPYRRLPLLPSFQAQVWR